ncbi:hypothetical protein ACA910_009479 [Epithemia clementina (nom. ined.)]
MTDLYSEFNEDDDDLEENEDDIGALGSILSWDEDDDDEGQAVNRSAAAMNVSLRERDTSTGTSAPPDMVQFSMKDGVPQFNFLTNSSSSLMGSGGGGQQAYGSGTQQSQQQQSLNAGNGGPDSSLTLQLPMPTPISKFNDSSSFQPTTHRQQQENDPLSSQQNVDASLQPQPMNTTNNNNSGNNNSGNAMSAMATVQQMVSQQQSQQGLAANFAQLLAQQAGSLFQQQQQSQQMQHQQQQSQQQGADNAAQQQAQQAVLQQAQQQLQQAAQQAAAQQQQGHQATTQQNNQLSSNQQQPQQQAPQQQMQLPFGNDPNTFFQQLQFAQFQHQLQMQAQQQQQQQQQSQRQAFSVAPTPATANTTNMQFTPSPAPQALNPRPAREGPSPAKRAKKSKPLPALKPASTKESKKSAPTPTPSAAAKTGVVSASDTDCEGPKKKSASSSNSSGSEAASSRAAAAPVPLLKKLLKQQEEDLDEDDYDQNLNPDEKAQANRDRNREHARNTRLRKKAYLEKLKATVEDLCRERDTLVSERAGAAGLLVEMHNTRTEVLMSFFALRSSNEKRRKLWSSILDESCFTCIMPVTPYRSFPASEVQVSKCQRTVMGIDAMMTDTASLHVLFQSLVDRIRYPEGKIEFRYTLVTEESVVAGNQMMARWVMSTVNATKCGALTEVAKQGMLCCKFNSAHRIIGLELMFDVMAFMLQLKQAAGSDSFSVIPNTVQTCQRSFDKPMVMTLANPPYTIVQVNNLWEEMTGYSSDDVVGKVSCAILQGSQTETKAVAEMMEDVRFRRPGTAHLRNLRKSGQEFRHSILVFPLSTDSRVTHYVALSNHVETVSASCSGDVSPTTATPSAQQQKQQQIAMSQQANGCVPPQNSLMPPFYPSHASSTGFFPPQKIESNSNVGLMAPPPAQNAMLPPSS